VRLMSSNASRLIMRGVADLPALLDRIRMLSDEPRDHGSRRRLAEIDETLTDGYARALALEAEAWRIRRQQAELARTLHEPAHAHELQALAVRLAAAEDELARLRRALRPLHEYADALRATIAAAG
jgi:predicted  nucleic acid-binding Zn-ribbon protein